MTPATTVLVDAPSSTAAPAVDAPVMPLPPPPRGDELGPQGRRALIGGVVVAHLVGGWALLQLDVVRDAVKDVVPVLMVDMIAPPEPPKPAPPPPPTPQPKRLAPAPAPIIAATPTPTPAPPTFVAPEPAPAPPQPYTAPPAPPAPPAAATTALAQVIKQVPPSAVRYVKTPDMHFPLLSRRAKESGTVVLRITVGVNGLLKEAWVHKSSGFERLDKQALEDMRSARFAPQTEDGKPVEWQTLAPLAYDL